MLWFPKSTNLNYSRSNITMSRTRVNQNRNRLLNNLTCNFYHCWLVICLAVFQCCINSRYRTYYLSHCFYLLNIICWPCILILKWKVPVHVGSSTFPTLEWSSILLWIFWLLSRRSSWLLLNLGWLLLLIPKSRRFDLYFFGQTTHSSCPSMPYGNQVYFLFSHSNS